MVRARRCRSRHRSGVHSVVSRAHAREHKLDFAIGSKRHADSIVEYPRSRRIASWYYQQLNRLLFRLDVRDTQVGLKVFSRQVVDEVVPLLLVKRFAFDLELLAVAAALGYDRMHELPVTLEYRFSGSELRSRAVVRALMDTLAIFYRLRILRTYQRKQRLFRRVLPVSPDAQPLVSVIGDPSAVEQLDYPRLALASSVDSAEGELIALIRANALPAGNWLTAAVPFFADPDVAAVVSPTLTPLRATVRERAAAAVLESRLGGASRRSRYFPGNVRTITDVPAESIVVRRGDLLAARAQHVDSGQLVAWLAEGGRRTIYTPDTSIAAAPPGLLRPHLTSTYAHAKARGRAARRSRGASTSAATTLSLAPAAAALVGVVLIAVGSGAVPRPRHRAPRRVCCARPALDGPGGNPLPLAAGGAPRDSCTHCHAGGVRRRFCPRGPPKTWLRHSRSSSRSTTKRLTWLRRLTQWQQRSRRRTSRQTWSSSTTARRTGAGRPRRRQPTVAFPAQW